MKTIILISIVILGALYGALAFLGSGGDYEAERLFHRALKAAGQVAANPEVAPPALVADVENRFQKITTKYPESPVARSVPVVLAEFYLAAKKYDKAISQLDFMIASNKGDRHLLSKTHFFKGVVYERQGERQKALGEFRMLSNDYADTRLGMEAPLYIARHYESGGEEARAKAAYNEAAVYYEKQESDNSGKGRGYAASMLLVETYLNMKDYEKAALALEAAMNKYRSPASDMRFLRYAEMIFLEKLDQTDRLISAYDLMKKNSKDDRLTKALQDRIDELGRKK